MSSLFSGGIICMNAFEEIEHSRVVNELMEVKDKLKNSFYIEHDVIKWNYDKCIENEEQEQAKVWRTLMIASCKDHEFEDRFEDDGTYLGYICVHCTVQSNSDEREDIELVVKKSCETCQFRGGVRSDTLFCNHPTIDTLENIQLGEWMSKYFENSSECIHWKGKIC